MSPHPALVFGQEAASFPGAEPGRGRDQSLFPGLLGSLSAPESVEIGDDRKTDDVAADTPPTPPLHDTHAHLRSVHALLDSLPAEFRSTQPRPPLQPPPPPTELSSAAWADPLLELPSPSEEPGPSATLSSMAAQPPPLHQRVPGSAAPGPGRHGREPPSMPELRRMLSSLDRVDRRLFALGDGRDDGEDGGGGGDDDGDDDEEAVDDEGASADNVGRGRAGRESGGDDPAVNGDPTKNDPSLEAARPAAAEGAEAGENVAVYMAVSRLQQAWRARSARKRRAAEAEAEREAYALRQERRQQAATAIQAAHRRAQARHRARAATEARRRRELRQQRRAAACAVLERAWQAFEGRRRAARALAEARERAAAAVASAAAARRAEETTRGAVLVQAVWRGMSARAALARRFEAPRARPPAAADVLPAEQEASKRQPPSDRARRLATGIAPAPQPQPSTFYNQLSQDPRRRRPLPEAHLAAAQLSKTLPPPPTRSFAASHSAAFGRDGKHGAELRAEAHQSQRFGTRPLARSAGAARPPRFADQETARIARIMKGNLQHWATSARSSSSSDDVDL